MIQLDPQPINCVHYSHAQVYMVMYLSQPDSIEFKRYPKIVFFYRSQIIINIGHAEALMDRGTFMKMKIFVQIH